MNCQEIQLQLSGYLEKSLDAIRMKSIETHLSSCPFCRAELHSLSDCIRLVSELPQLETPSGFRERILAQAREIGLEPLPRHRFFAAFKHTVPVQAAAVLLISVLAVVLYQKEPQVKDLGFTEAHRAAIPAEVQEKATLGAETAPSTAPAAPSSRSAHREIKRQAESAPRPVIQARQEPPAGATSTKDAVVTPQSPPAVEPEKAMERALERPIAAPRRPTIQAQEVSTRSESLRSSADALEIGAAVGALSRAPFRAAPFSAALSPLSEPNPDFEFVVKRRASERRDRRETASDDLRKRPEATVEALRAGEHSPASPAPPANQVVEIRWFTVAPQHYEQFKKDLAAEAIIDSQKPVAAKEIDLASKTPRELLIKVTILPAER